MSRAWWTVRLVGGLGRFVRRQRHDARRARPRYIDRGNEALRGVLFELGLADFLRLLKRHRRPMRDAGGLEYDQFARRDRLADFGDVVFDRFRQGALHQPDGGEGMAIEQEGNRV